MSQTDFNVANASGAAVRADLNAHLDAMASLSAGTAAPLTTFPNQWWLDSSTNILKQRDNANTVWVNAFQKIAAGWIPYRSGVLLGTASTRAAGTATLSGLPDIQDIQEQRGIFAAVGGTANIYVLTLSPAPAAYVTGNRFTFKVNVTNTGPSTLNVNGLGAKSIKKGDGVTDPAAGDLTIGQIVSVVYDGTNFQMTSPTGGAGGGGGLAFIDTAVASDSASLTITGLNSDFDTWLITGSDLLPVSDQVAGWLRVGDSGGIDSGANDYGYHVQILDDSATSYAALNSTSGVAQIALSQTGTSGVGNAAGSGIGFALFLHQPGDGQGTPWISGTYQSTRGTSVITGGAIISQRRAVITLDRINFLFSTGNIASGRLTVSGVAHA